MSEKEWTDEYKAMVMKRLAEILEWCNVMWYLPLDQAQKKFPKAEITEEKGFQDGKLVICRRYINPFGGRGFRVFDA